MDYPVDFVQPPYSQMTDEKKLEVLIIEMKRDENDMRFKITDRFVFDENVPWWVRVFSKMRYTLIVIPFIVFLILTLIIGIPVKTMRLYTILLTVVVHSLDVFGQNKRKGNPPPFDDNTAAYTLELLYRASLLPQSGYSRSNILKKITIKTFYDLILGLLIFSVFFSFFW